jgi:hypothetical protein
MIGLIVPQGVKGRPYRSKDESLAEFHPSSKLVLGLAEPQCFF